VGYEGIVSWRWNHESSAQDVNQLIGAAAASWSGPVRWAWHARAQSLSPADDLIQVSRDANWRRVGAEREIVAGRHDWRALNRLSRNEGQSCERTMSQ
jgi:hypothetical protein